MFTHRLTLFRLFGFPIRIDWSWFILALLITWSLADGVFPHYYPTEEYPGLKAATYWWMGLAGSLGLFVSILLHELGHALVARRFGMPMKGITLFIFGGVAEMTEEPPTARAEFWMAIAGPAVSLVIVGICWAAQQAGIAASAPVSVTGVLGYLWVINAVLIGFNCIPAFPLDGGRVLRSILWAARGNLRWATRITSGLGGAFGIGLIFLGVLNLFSGNPVGGIWWCLIGLFLRGAAQMSYQQLLMRRALEGEPISRFMQPDPVVVDRSLTVQQLVDDYVYKRHHKMYPVMDDGRLLGMVTMNRIKEVDPDAWEQKTVGDLTVSCNDQNTIAPGADALEALRRMQQNDLSRLLVVEDNQLKGLVTLKDLLGFIALKVELEEK